MQCSFDIPGGPCYECTLQGSECVIDESADKRRKVAIKRAEEDARLAQENFRLAQEDARVAQGGARRAEENERLALERERRHKMNEEFYRRFLCRLLQAIRVGGPEAVAAIVSVIKSTESQDQIRNVVSECLAHHAFHYGTKNENLADGMLPDGPMPCVPPDGPM